MKTPYVVGRLETMLQIWSQILFVLSAGVRAFKHEPNGLLLNWPRLRRNILERKPFNADDFDMPKGVVDTSFGGNSCYQRLPEIVTEWSHCSRRVYQLSKDTQIDLELTSVGGVTWADLQPPFPCFIITLAIPLKGQNNSMIDTIVVQTKGRQMYVIALGNELDAFKPMPHEVKNGIATASRGGNTMKAMSRIASATAEGYFAVPPADYCWDDEDNPPDEVVFQDSLDGQGFNLLGCMGNEAEAKAATAHAWVPIFRMVIGLCLRLSGKEGGLIVDGSPLPSDHPFMMDPDAITSTGNLFEVNSKDRLTEDERTIHDLMREVGSFEALRQLGVHFRQAHYRRPPGQGSNPNAQRSVRVRWSIVNEKRLPEKALPQGTVVVV